MRFLRDREIGGANAFQRGRLFGPTPTSSQAGQGIVYALSAPGAPPFLPSSGRKPALSA